MKHEITIKAHGLKGFYLVDNHKAINTDYLFKTYEEALQAKAAYVIKLQLEEGNDLEIVNQ